MSKTDRLIELGTIPAAAPLGDIEIFAQTEAGQEGVRFYFRGLSKRLIPTWSGIMYDEAVRRFEVLASSEANGA